MANDVKKLKAAQDKEFLNFKANQLGVRYKTVQDYFTDNGKVNSSSAVYRRRVAAYGTYSTEWKANLNEAGVQSGKLLPTYQTQIEKMYPELAAYMRQYPELQKIFRDAVTSPVPVAEGVLNAKMRGTSFWQTLTDSRVAWDTATDASREQMTQETSVYIRGIGQRAGVNLQETDPKVRDLAVKAKREGWSEQMISDAVGAMLVADDEDVVQLRAGFLGTQVNDTLNNYGYPGRATTRQSFVNDWVTKIATGAESTETLQTYLKEQAKVWYPSFTAEFEAGRTFKQVVDPYARIAASTLEKDQESIDWSDPLYSVALNQGPEKQNSPMSFADWTKKLRSDSAYGWNNTQQANDLAMQVGSSLVRAFGKVR
jgi:hypothetical protein